MSCPASEVHVDGGLILAQAPHRRSCCGAQLQPLESPLERDGQGVGP